MDESETQEHHKKDYAWLKDYHFVKGQSGNPGGRPKGAKSLKTYAREYLESLPDDQKQEYLARLPLEVVWKMAEGNPESNVSQSIGLTLVDKADKEAAQKAVKSFLNGHTSNPSDG